jgi:hypothetical protein
MSLKSCQANKQTFELPAVIGFFFIFETAKQSSLVSAIEKMFTNKNFTNWN